MYCAYCGGNVPQDGGFCPACGRPTAGAGPVASGLINWEYDNFIRTWEHGKGGQIGQFLTAEVQARADFWNQIQGWILPLIQERIDQGWHPITEIGPACLKLRSFSKREGKFMRVLFAVPTAGLTLLDKDWFWELESMEVKMRRRRR